MRQADIEIGKGAPDKAAAILRDGLKIYPHHPVAHLLLGKALALMGKYSPAIAAMQTGCDLINAPDTYAYYKTQIEKMKKERSEFDDPGPQETKETESEEEKPAADKTDLTLSIEEPDEEELEEIAKSITEDKDKQETGEDDSAVTEAPASLASETIAKILANQQQFDEAINTYKLLKKLHPGRKEYFNEKIAELEARKAMNE